jgi:hypothetical protein
VPRRALGRRADAKAVASDSCCCCCCRRLLRQRGRTMVASDGTPVGTIRWLAEQWPGLLQELDEKGRLPLHFAAALDPALVPILPLARLFVERWPGALAVADRQGFFPFQAAAVADAPLDVVYLLARLRPDRWISDAAGRVEQRDTALPDERGLGRGPSACVVDSIGTLVGWLARRGDIPGPLPGWLRGRGPMGRTIGRGGS